MDIDPDISGDGSEAETEDAPQRIESDEASKQADRFRHALIFTLALIGAMVLLVASVILTPHVGVLWGEHGVGPLLLKTVWFCAFISAMVGADRASTESERIVAIALTSILLLPVLARMCAIDE